MHLLHDTKVQIIIVRINTSQCNMLWLRGNWLIL